jgi:hypothetical protein
MVKGGERSATLMMFIDASGSLGTEHVRDMRRAADAFRTARAARHGDGILRAWLARAQLGPVDNYRVR